MDLRLISNRGGGVASPRRLVVLRFGSVGVFRHLLIATVIRVALAVVGLYVNVVDAVGNDRQIVRYLAKVTTASGHHFDHRIKFVVSVGVVHRSQ